MGELLKFPQERIKIRPITLAPINQNGDTPNIVELRKRLSKGQAATGFIPSDPK